MTYWDKRFTAITAIKGVYIRNKTTGLLFTDVNSSIDYEYEETDIEDELTDTEALNIILERDETE